MQCAIAGICGGLWIHEIQGVMNDAGKGFYTTETVSRLQVEMGITAMHRGFEQSGCFAGDSVPNEKAGAFGRKIQFAGICG